MNGMTLPSRYIIQNSGPGGLRSSMLPEAPHNIESLRVSVEETFFFIESWMPERTRDLRLSKQAALTSAPEPSLSVGLNIQAQSSQHETLSQQWKDCGPASHVFWVSIKINSWPSRTQIAYICNTVAVMILLKLKIVGTNTQNLIYSGGYCTTSGLCSDLFSVLWFSLGYWCVVL